MEDSEEYVALVEMGPLALQNHAFGLVLFEEQVENVLEKTIESLTVEKVEVEHPLALVVEDSASPELLPLSQLSSLEV